MDAHKTQTITYLLNSNRWALTQGGREEESERHLEKGKVTLQWVLTVGTIRDSCVPIPKQIKCIQTVAN